jgi:hypothetical protein
MKNVNRQICFYEKNGNKYISEFQLRNTDLSDLQSLITKEKYKNDILLYNCYSLNKQMLDKLDKLDNQKFNIDLDNFEYYLESTKK